MLPSTQLPRSLPRFVLAALLFSSQLQAVELEAYLKEHCLRCHGPEKDKGDFRIDTLSRDFASGADAELWFEVVTRIGAGEMPPEEEPQPPAEVSDQVMEKIAALIREGEKARMASRAPVDHFRLSREEYSHTIYDLLGVRYDTRAPGAFTEDPDWHGFERLGSELSLSPSHVEKYLKAATEIIDLAFPDTEPFRLKNTRDALAIDWHNGDKRKELDAIGITPRIRMLIWPGLQLSYLRPDGGYRQSAGLYRARLQVSGLAPEGGRPPHLVLYSKELDRTIFEADVLAPEKEPVILEFETFLPAGRYDISISNPVPGPSNAQRPGREGGFVFTTLDDPKSRAPWQRKMTDDEGQPLYPFLIFDWIEWEGPLERPEDLRKREGLFPDKDANPEAVRAALTRFAERAWRRPVTAGEIARYEAIVAAETAAGSPFRAAYKTALIGLLASKHFAYLAEGSPGEHRTQLTGNELASRLSYFLWSSMPDDTLRDAARDGSLTTPEGLRAQVRRMMEDPRIARFTEAFPRQWLHLKKVGMFPPDEKLYPDYDRWLETSMINEPIEFFAEIFRHDLPLAEFLDSNWTMLNPRLAAHYGIPAPKSADFEKVALLPGHRRGGLLTQAAILSLTSDGTRHRPVHRGVWLSEVILGKTPPPPPPNVPAIEPNPVTAPKATIRMKLAAHNTDANCAACHAKIDPLGLAFDHYDAIGRWRTEEVVADGTGANPPVDASGTLPDGRAFKDAEEFKQLLGSDPEVFARAFTEKLAVYALRRAMTVDDHDELDALVEQSSSSQHRLRSLIETFIVSDLFQSR